MNFWRNWIRKQASPDELRVAWRASKRALKEARMTGNPDAIIKSVLEAADIAESERNADKLRTFSDSLLRRERYEQAWELCVRAFRLAATRSHSRMGRKRSRRPKYSRSIFSKRKDRRGVAFVAVHCSGSAARPPLHRACGTAACPALAPQLRWGRCAAAGHRRRRGSRRGRRRRVLRDDSISSCQDRGGGAAFLRDLAPRSITCCLDPATLSPHFGSAL